MAEVIDEIVETGEIEAVDANEIDLEHKQEPETTTVDLPAKYRGKSYDELAKTVLNQELMIGRQSQEVGEVRRLADELLKSQFSNQAKVEPVAEVDFFENPKEAIRQAVANDPSVIAARQFGVDATRNSAKEKFYGKHPDANELLQDADFMDYVKASPVRQEMLKRADAYDFESGDELFGNYKALKATKQVQSNEIGQAERTRSIKSVAVDSGGSGETGKKVYSGAALRLLQMRDPRKYESMQDEILLAYNEDRVR